DSDDCSLGFSSRQAAQTFPSALAAPLKALGIDGVPPFTPASVDPNPNLAVLNLLNNTGSVPFYKLSRRLYLATGPAGVGFDTLPGQGVSPTSGEAMLAKCFSKDSLVAPAMSSWNYVPIPSDKGGVQCLDYPETNSSNDVPVNTRGPGNVALPGCGNA